VSLRHRQPGQPAAGEYANTIVVVSGLPRSGTSLMMMMLETGGVPPVVDHLRQADVDNPEGYYEYERVKQLNSGDTLWLADANGCAVKIITALLVHLPPEYTYKVILMQRRLSEVVESQRRMLAHRNITEQANNALSLIPLYTRHLGEVKKWMDDQPNLSALTVDYNALVEGEAQSIVDEIAIFLNRPLKKAAMHRSIIPALYRNRAEL